MTTTNQTNQTNNQVNEESANERLHITFKFEDAVIKYPVDKFDGADLFRTIIELKQNGGTLENGGKVYDISELKEMVLSFEVETAEIKGEDK
ncbi:hypothetical protein [Paenibacillus glacialis]|uniref:Uncharacterized protein n=1 Tax=Paenibacillus glacialis TaxID=494026 RepID=A0A168NNR0_9BACL|nr:hypothetical protein [Paenibacillus glacialis]OAB45973.1 hypothetical protein PGLA_00830 [Paenibacillus glacialis]